MRMKAISRGRGRAALLLIAVIARPCVAGPATAPATATSAPTTLSAISTAKPSTTPAIAIAKPTTAPAPTKPMPRDDSLDAQLQNYEKMYVGSYDQLGHHSDAWDKPARKLLGLEAKMLVAADNDGMDDLEQVDKLLASLKNLNCKDPQVLMYLAEKSLSQMVPRPQMMKNGVLRVVRKDYPVALRLEALVDGANSLTFDKKGIWHDSGT